MAIDRGVEAANSEHCHQLIGKIEIVAGVR